MSRTAAFRLIAIVFLTVMASSAAPSPLYPIYGSQWGFGPSTLTVVFAVYALALLAALLVVGSLSDHVGRKPVISASLLLLIGSLVVFVFADSVTWLIVARVGQGLAAGAVMGALAAATIDLQPSERLGSLVNTLAPSVGLAGGGLVAGLLVQFAPMPTVTVYLVLIAILTLLTVAIAVVPESAVTAGFTDRAHLRRELTPAIGVPASIRSRFWPVVPALVATWSLGGFHLSLGPSIMRTEFGFDGAVLAGLDIFALFTAGAAGAAVASSLATPTGAGGRSVSSRAILTLGVATLGAGIVVNLVALIADNAPLYFAGTALSGSGWGATIFGAMRIVAIIAPPEQRAGVFATTLVLSYLAFSVPAIAGGVAVGVWGLGSTAIVYGAFVIACAAVSIVAVGRAARPDSTGPSPIG